MVKRMKEKMAIIGPVDAAGKNMLRQRLHERFEIMEIPSRTAYEQMKDVSAVVLRTLNLNREDILKLKKLKIIQRWGAGYDTVDIKAAAEQGVQVTVAAGLNAVPVAEYTVLLMLAVYRNLINTHNNVINGEWRDDGFIQRSYVLNGKQAGLIGMGSIGKKVAALVQAFGAQVIYHDVLPLGRDEEEKLHVRYRPLEDLLKESDIVSIHVPLLEQTRHLIDTAALRMMKKNAILINTARGGVINEADLYDALKTGTILGAGMDVFEQEPLRKGHPLLELPNIVVSSHNAGNTADNSIFMAERCAENILTVINGGQVSKPDLVNGHLLKEWRNTYERTKDA